MPPRPTGVRLLQGKEFVIQVLKNFMAESGLEPRLMGANNLSIDEVSFGTVRMNLRITAQHTNRLRTLHGGTIASLVDLGGSLAVASRGLYSTGVSTDLNVTYMAPGGRPGDTIRITAMCDKMGGTLAYTNITFFNEKEEMVARGSHTKFIKGALAAQKEPFSIPSDAPPTNQDDHPSEEAADLGATGVGKHH